MSNTIDDLRMMKWSPKYHGRVQNDTVSGGIVDMWLLVDDASGESIVSLGVPKGRSDIAGYIAACCGNPVRWVTGMWRPDPRADGLDDPDDKMAAEARSIADALTAALFAWMSKNGRESANGWTLNDALAFIWFAFCGQLSHDDRGRLLFKFLQLATTDYDPDKQSPKPWGARHHEHFAPAERERTQSRG